MKRGKHHRHNKEKNEDRISNLPDHVLHHILSFSDAKQAVQTCILSTRWKNLWKTLPTLKLTSSQFTTLKAFTYFVSRVLFLRDASTSLDTFDFHRDGNIEPQLLNKILKYAISHNVRRLKINGSFRNLPSSFFSCHTLTSLDLSVNFYSEKKLFPNSLNLPALTNLSLQQFIFCVNDDGRVNPFSSLNSLNSLKIYGCLARGNQSLCISNATLTNLKIHDGRYYDWPNMKFFQLSTPSLCTFDFEGTPCQKLCGSLSNLSSVKHVEIYAYWDYKSENAPLVLLNWLIELSNTESLKVTMNTLEVLSLVPDLLKVKFPSLCTQLAYSVSPKQREIVKFLLQNAPSAKVYMLH